MENSNGLLSSDFSFSDKKSIPSKIEKLQFFWQSLDIIDLNSFSYEDIIPNLVLYLPSIFTRPESTGCRIRILEKEYQTGGFVPTKNKTSVPIKVRKRHIGSIEFHYNHNTNPNDFDNTEDLIIMRFLGDRLSLLSYIYEEQQKVLQMKNEVNIIDDNTLRAWSMALEANDKEVSGHSKRVTRLMVDFARDMGINDESLTQIRRGALLHDIGKLGIPDSILNKPGTLTPEEYEIVKKHPIYAKTWFSNIESLSPALIIPYYHHERWDGTGYPEGLTGEAIPLIARMFSIVDTWDAMTSDRPYRKAMHFNEALHLVLAESGKQFDPKLVDKFLIMLTRKEQLRLSHHIRVQTFGDSQVWVQSHQITLGNWQTRNAKELFFLILVHPEGLTKEQIAAHLWPEISPKKLSSHFKNTLYRARQATHPDLIVTNGKHYLFNRALDYISDFEIFIAELDYARQSKDVQNMILHLQKAIEVYQGDYLPEVEGLWAAPDREHFRIMYIEALIKLAYLHFEVGDQDHALRISQKALKEDILNEEAYRLQMRIYAAKGNQSRVIQQFQRCQSEMENSLACPPSRETCDLFQSLIYRQVQMIDKAT